MDAEVEGPETLTFIEAGPEVEAFANALDDCLSPLLKPAEKRRRILDLPQKYFENATRRLSQLQPRRNRIRSDDVDMEDDEDSQDSLDEIEAEYRKVEQEVQTWDLLRRLLPLRHSEQNGRGPSLRQGLTAQSSSQDLLQEFLESDPVARERHAILQWLQTSAASRPDIDDLVHELQQKANRGDIIAHGWIHTRTAIKLRKSVTSWPHLLDKQPSNISETHVNKDGAPMVTQLDPDAATRQGRKLEPQDEYFERAVSLGCFEHLRRGSSMNTIRDWCQDRTEMWRAVSMSALLLSLDDQESVPETDASALALWRRMCYALARQEGNDPYERAVYGVLSGDIASVERAGTSWDDALFANYNALLRTQFDKYLLSKCSAEEAANLTQTFSSFDAIQYHGDENDLDTRLIRALESHPTLRREAKDPNKSLQAAFIAKEIDEYLYEEGNLISKSLKGERRIIFSPSGADVNSEGYFSLAEHDGFRTVAHVYLLVTLLNRLDEEERQGGPVATDPERQARKESILAGYTNYLRLANLSELIPLYCSVLDTPRCYEVLSSNLILETDPQRRRDQLRLIKKTGLDIAQFVRTQTWLLYEDLGPAASRPAPSRKLSIVEGNVPTARTGRPIKADFFGSDEDAVEPKHEYLIRSLEWLMMVDQTWPDVFSFGTRTYKYLLGNMHLNAARMLLEKVTFAEVVAAMGYSMDELDDNTLNDLGFWAQRLADDGITDFSPQQALMEARNFRELEALVRALDNLETMGSLVAMSAEVPASNKPFWSKVGHEIRSTKEYMQPLLSNWLLLGIEAGDDELRRLRQAYLTETILAYVSALHFAGTALSRDNLLECMELAAVIAEGESDLAASFVEAGRMRELVEAFAACSKALAMATGGGGRSTGSSSKKLREMGWSRDLWSVSS